MKYRLYTVFKVISFQPLKDWSRKQLLSTRRFPSHLNFFHPTKSVLRLKGTNQQLSQRKVIKSIKEMKTASLLMCMGQNNTRNVLNYTKEGSNLTEGK